MYIPEHRFRGRFDSAQKYFRTVRFSSIRSTCPKQFHLRGRIGRHCIAESMSLHTPSSLCRFEAGGRHTTSERHLLASSITGQGYLGRIDVEDDAAASPDKSSNLSRRGAGRTNLDRPVKQNFIKRNANVQKKYKLTK